MTSEQLLAISIWYSHLKHVCTKKCQLFSYDTFLLYHLLSKTKPHKTKLFTAGFEKRRHEGK